MTKQASTMIPKAPSKAAGATPKRKPPVARIEGRKYWIMKRQGGILLLKRCKAQPQWFTYDTDKVELVKQADFWAALDAVGTYMDTHGISAQAPAEESLKEIKEALNAKA